MALKDKNKEEYTISKRWFNAYGTDPNYEWYPTTVVKKFLEGLYPYINDKDTNIELNGEDFGTICMPTGTGKSSVIYDDIVRRIKDAIETNTRTIINISSPLLKLNQQLTLDMLFVVFELFNNATSPLCCKTNGKKFLDLCSFYFNSSESDLLAYKILKANKFDSVNNKTTNDICIGEIDPANFSDFDNFVNSNKLIAIVCSCHPSLEKFINYIERKNLKETGFKIITYIDESHTVSERGNENTEDIGSAKVDIKALCKFSTSVYAVSATPDEKITKKINKFSRHHQNLSVIQDPYFIHVYPADAISRGLIVAPYVDIWYSSALEINTDTICEIYEDSHIKNSIMKYQKILVNCPSGNKGDAKKIKAIYEELRDHYNDKIEKGELRVYATSYETSYLSTILLSPEDKFESMKEFTSSIDSAKCDCIVLHIKQMIAGIDISSITQTIMFLNDVGNNMKTIIQTCGRCLRSAAGERCKPIDQRKKKFGLCTFVINQDDDETECKLKDLFIRYYMCDNIKFNKQYSAVGSGADIIWRHPRVTVQGTFNIENHKFMIDIEQYIKDNERWFKWMLSTNDVETAIIEGLKKFFSKDNTSMLFDDRTLLDFAREQLRNLVN